MNQSFAWKKQLTALALIAALPACSGADKQPEGEADKVIWEVKSSAERVVPVAGEEAIAALGERDFAFDFMHELDAGENLVFSPHSISAAFAMVGAAAEGETLSEIRDAMAFAEVDEAFHRSQDGLSLALSARQRAATDDFDAVILEEVNDVWVHADAPPDSGYLDTLAAFYGTGVHQAHFDTEPEQVRAAINADISQTTRGLIPELLPQGTIDAFTVLVLTNALYFKAPWIEPLGVYDPAPFQRLDGSTSSVPQLGTTDGLAYAAGEEYVSVALPYVGGELELLLVVPDLGAYERVRSNLSASFIDELVATRTIAQIELRLPKFEIKSDVPATEVLATLGISKLFVPGADLPGIPMPPNLSDPYVSAVLHQATIAIDEKGTEASAATAVIFSGTTSAPPEPTPLVIDRPFIMAVRDIPTGSLLFLGQVVDP